MTWMIVCSRWLSSICLCKEGLNLEPWTGAPGYTWPAREGATRGGRGSKNNRTVSKFQRKLCDLVLETKLEKRKKQWFVKVDDGWSDRLAKAPAPSSVDPYKATANPCTLTLTLHCSWTWNRRLKGRERSRRFDRGRLPQFPAHTQKKRPIWDQIRASHASLLPRFFR